MAGKIYLGRDSTAHNNRKGLVGVDGKARALKKVYVGVADKAKPVYTTANGITLTWNSNMTLRFSNVTAKLSDGYTYQGYYNVCSIKASFDNGNIAIASSLRWQLICPQYAYAEKLYTTPYTIDTSGASCTMQLVTSSSDALEACYYTYGKGEAVLTASTLDGATAQLRFTVGRNTNSDGHRYFYISRVREA